MVVPVQYIKLLATDNNTLQLPRAAYVAQKLWLERINSKNHADNDTENPTSDNPCVVAGMWRLQEKR
jgi:hypothetical protein